MSNEVTTPDPASPAIPAFLQAHLTQNQATGLGKPSADLASLATAQNSTPRLSLRGKIFRFMEGQDEVFKSRDPVDVFIVGVEPGPGLFTKTFYSKPYAGGDSAGEPPDCSSADGVRPDPWIQQPINHECKSCPKNQFGSATSRKGRPSKACHDSKRLYVTRAAHEDGPVNSTLYLSQVPVTSLRSLADYGKAIQEMGVEPWMVKTQLSMEEDSEFPEMLFKVSGFIEESDMGAMKERVSKREWANARNLLLQNQPQRMELPAHLQSALGGAAAAAPPMTATSGMGPASVDKSMVERADGMIKVTASTGGKPADTASNEDVLSKW